MESVTLRVLKKLASEREVSIEDCAALLPRKTNDHLDFYPLASLIKAGFADMYMNTDGEPFRDQNEMQMALSLYAWATLLERSSSTGE